MRYSGGYGGGYGGRYGGGYGGRNTGGMGAEALIPLLGVGALGLLLIKKKKSATSTATLRTPATASFAAPVCAAPCTTSSTIKAPMRSSSGVPIRRTRTIRKPLAVPMDSQVPLTSSKPPPLRSKQIINENVAVQRPIHRKYVLKPTMLTKLKNLIGY